MIDMVVDEVGEKNVVQIVTDNATNYKAAGQKLMEKIKGNICIGLHVQHTVLT